MMEALSESEKGKNPALLGKISQFRHYLALLLKTHTKGVVLRL